MTSILFKGISIYSGMIPALLVGFISGCVTKSGAASYGNAPDERLANAQAIFRERCRLAGEKIYRVVDNVEGLFLINRRPANNNYDDQFSMDDPYGNDAEGDRYIESFIRGGQAAGTPIGGMAPDHIGYKYIDAVDPRSGIRYRYTGHIEEPWQNDKHWLKGETRFVLDKNAAPKARTRYGVEYHDISTREERDHWIAGSSLKVIDLETNSIIAERIGYMMDPKQGSRVGGRGPWIYAADNSCPAFSQGPHQVLSQIGQADRFVEKALHPAGS